MAKTFGEYLKSLGILGWLLMGLNLFTALGAFELYTEISALQNFPSWGWIVLLGVGLIVMPFRAFHKVRTQRDELQKQLDDIKNACPNIVLVGTENIQAPIRNVATGAILGEPVFTQVKFANNPSTLSQAVDATNVAGHIDIYTQDGIHLFNMIGRWSETKEEALGAQPTEMEQITIPANGRPNPMDIVLKYHEDQDCYGHTNKGRRIAPTDWRDEQKRLSVRTYWVKVRLRGSNVDKEFWLNLVNKGAGTDIELQVPTLHPGLLNCR